MATRVIAAEVKEIIQTDLSDQVVETSFIDTANTYVDANLLSVGLTNAQLTKIELYLAAHFLALTEEQGGLIEDHLGEAEAHFADVYKAGLSSTRFGQTAMLMDSSGTLQALNKAATSSNLKAEFRVV